MDRSVQVYPARFLFLRWSLVWSMIAGGIIGCGQKVPANPKTYPVFGTVMVDGEPLSGGQVMFQRTDDPNNIARGFIGTDGSYRANSFPQQEGVVPGEYLVWLDQRAGKPERIAPKLTSGETSGVTYTVKPEDNNFDVEFQSTGDSPSEEE
jgi:hypothetical protein